jgi:hypothetical protein
MDGRVAILLLAFVFPIGPRALPVVPGLFMFSEAAGLPIVVDPGLSVVPVFVLPPMVVVGRFPMLVFGRLPMVVFGLFPIPVKGLVLVGGRFVGAVRLTGAC